VGDDIRAIFAEWIAYLRDQKLWGVMSPMRSAGIRGCSSMICEGLSAQLSVPCPDGVGRHIGRQGGSARRARLWRPVPMTQPLASGKSARFEDEPDESTEFEGMVDFHWGFDSHAEAERLANSLREISHKPEIVVLRLSCYDDIAASVTLKDDRHARH